MSISFAFNFFLKKIFFTEINLIFKVDKVFQTLLRLEQWQKNLDVTGKQRAETRFGLANRKYRG
jgi:hypothetical protein